MFEFCCHRILVTFQETNPASNDQARQIIRRVINGPSKYYKAFKQSLIETGQEDIVTDILNKGKTCHAYYNFVNEIQAKLCSNVIILSTEYMSPCINILYQ